MAHDPTTRRNFLHGGAMAAAGLAAGSARAAQDPTPPQGSAPDTPETGLPDIPAEALGTNTITTDEVIDPSDPRFFPRFHFGRGGPIGSPSDRGKLTWGYRSPGLPPVPVVMPDLQKLPWTWVNGAKEFHLIAEPVRRELLPGMEFYFWGFNGSMPGPLIEANQGDRVRFVVHNRLPEHTSIHFHGMELPVHMDGVEGLTQEPIPPGKTFVYEFDLHQDGTFFYHSHGAMQEIMGMAGMFVIHPRNTHEPAVDHDFGLVFQQFSILPQAEIPNSVSSQFNFFTINGRSGPITTPMLTRLGSRVRIRLMNFSPMNVHAIHFHGHTFWVTGTEGGRIPESAWIPRNTVNINIAQVHDIEFVANNPGDWIFHCHVLHHMMNHMVSMTGPLGLRMAHAVRGMGTAGMGGGGGGQMGGMAGSTSPGGAGSLGPGSAGPLHGHAGSSGVGQHVGLSQIGLGGGMPDLRSGPGIGPGAGLGLGNVLGGGILADARGLPAGLEMAPGIGQPGGGHALSGDFGQSMGRGLGPTTPPNQPERTGPPIGGGGSMGGGETAGGVDYYDPRWQVPGFPQDMMKMKEMMTSEEALARIRRPETNGMRYNWYTGVRAMMTVVRVLPDDLYEKVLAGVPLPDGASVPGSGTDEGLRFDEDNMRG